MNGTQPAIDGVVFTVTRTPALGGARCVRRARSRRPVWPAASGASGGRWRDTRCVIARVTYLTLTKSTFAKLVTDDVIFGAK